VTRVSVGTLRTPLSRAARKGGLLVVVAVLFLPFGVPRWLAGDAAPARSNGAARFATLCREHGGTPAKTRGRQACLVRYGGRVYLMDAITPDGFDEDTARFQRQGCELARRQARAAAASGQRRAAFVYHPTTGVCEHRR
jgi:hypothetical protein